MLDGQFSRDIEALRVEFAPADRRADIFRQIRVLAPGYPDQEGTPQGGAEACVSLRGSDLYLLAFHNAHGDFWLQEAEIGPNDIDGQEADRFHVVNFGSNYNNLGIWQMRDPLLTAPRCWSAVHRIAQYQIGHEYPRIEIGMMALIIAESLRHDIVLGLFGAIFGGFRVPRLGLPGVHATDDLYGIVTDYADTWAEQTARNRPGFVALPPGPP